MPSECQTVLTQVRPDVLSGLIWVHPNCLQRLSTDDTSRHRIIIARSLFFLIFIRGTQRKWEATNEDKKKSFHRTDWGQLNNINVCILLSFFVMKTS